MTLQQKKSRIGGCTTYSNINDSYTLINDVIKKGGFSNNSSVTDPYDLLNQIIKKGGSKCKLFANIDSVYPVTEQQNAKGGNIANVLGVSSKKKKRGGYNLLDTLAPIQSNKKKGGVLGLESVMQVGESLGLIGKPQDTVQQSTVQQQKQSITQQQQQQSTVQQQQQSTATPSSATPSSATPSSATPSSATPSSATPSSATPTQTEVAKTGGRRGGCGCNTVRKYKGGGIELAPFAAAVALMAARFAVDMNEENKDIKKKTRVSEETTKKSKTRRTVKSSRSK